MVAAPTPEHAEGAGVEERTGHQVPAHAGQAHDEVGGTLGLRAALLGHRVGEQRAAPDEAEVPADPERDQGERHQHVLVSGRDGGKRTGGDQRHPAPRHHREPAVAIGQVARDRRGQEHPAHVEGDDEADGGQRLARILHAGVGMQFM